MAHCDIYIPDFFSAPFLARGKGDGFLGIEMDVAKRKDRYHLEERPWLQLAGAFFFDPGEDLLHARQADRGDCPGGGQG